MPKARPNLFIVGAPKAGTTSLFEYLAPHPDICMSSTKEPRYFCRDIISPSVSYPCVRTEEEYLNLFAHSTSESWLGEGTPQYLASPNGATNIAQFEPDARCIIMLRDPVSMMFSMHSQKVFGGLEDVVDFSQAVALAELRRQGKSLPPGTPYPMSVVYEDLVDYEPQVTRFFDAFGRERVMVILFDDFVSDTPGVYRKVLQFLETDDSFQPDFAKHNTAGSKRYRNLGMRQFLSSHPRLKKLVGKLPGALRGRAASALSSASDSEIDRAKAMPAELKAELTARFAPKVASLAKLIDRDLSRWQAL